MRDFIGIDPLALTENAIQSYEADTNDILYAGDERRIMINTFVYVALAVLNKQNKLMNDNFVQYAKGEALDILGMERDVTRNPPQHALVTIQFTLSSAQDRDVIIPEGTRVTADGMLFFATIAPCTIFSGDIKGIAVAKSTNTGTIYNGLTPGTIQSQVDLVPFVQTVVNIDSSQGGSEEENDDSFRERILLKLSTLSTAGAEMTYRYWVKTADSTIADMYIHSPSPAVVEISLLMQNGTLPTQPIIDRVNAVVNAKDVRPLTDYVTIKAAETVFYDIDLVYYIESRQATEQAALLPIIESSAEEFVLAQKQQLGMVINPDILKYYMLKAGAFRVDIMSPSYTTVNKNSVAIARNFIVKYGGLL